MGNSAHARKNLKRVLSVIMLILVTLCFWPLTTAHADAADAGPASAGKNQLVITSDKTATFNLYKIVGMNEDGTPALEKPFGVEDNDVLTQEEANELFENTGLLDSTGKPGEKSKALASKLNGQKGKTGATEPFEVPAGGSKTITGLDNGYYLLTGNVKNSNEYMNPVLISVPYKTAVKSADGNTTSYSWSGLLTVNANKWSKPYNPPSSNVQYKVVKVWKGDKASDRPVSITVRVKGTDGSSGQYTLNSSNDWSHSWWSRAGVDYTVQEISVPGYTSEVTVTPNKTAKIYTITNTKGNPDSEKTSVSGTKTWDDENDKAKKRPSSITVNLLANGEKADSRKVSAADNWTYKFDNLPTKDSNGNTIKYTVSEDPVTDYATEVTGYDIKNTYKPGTEGGTIKGQKIWEDAEGHQGMPDWIRIRLLANGEDVNIQQIEKDPTTGEWNYSFSNLPKTDDKGNPIKYDVIEETPEGYQATNKGVNVINKYSENKINIPVNKVWSGDNGAKHDPVTIHLYKNGVDTTRQVQLSDENNWVGVFKDLPAVDANGNPVTYTVKEDAVDGYGASIKTIQEKGTTPAFTVTNTKGKPNQPGTTVEYPPTDDDSGDTPNTPTKQNKTVKAVKTGDTTVLMPAVAILIVSGVLLAILGAALRRRNKTE